MISDSTELRRIIALPRRQLDLEESFELKQSQCSCAKNRRECLRALHPIQATALSEAAREGGLFAPIAVGAGKTLLGLLLPLALQVERTVYLCLAGQEEQIRREHAWAAEHVMVPPLGPRGLSIVSYHVLSRPESTRLLFDLRPDLIIADEAHKLRHRSSVTTRRVLLYLAEHERTKMVAWSGTLTSRSLADYAHLGAMTLRDLSPFPVRPDVVSDWATVLDEGAFEAPGMLQQLCRKGESVRQGFHRRMIETPGVVYSQERAEALPRLSFEWRALSIPGAVSEAYEGVLRSWERPDGEELVDAVEHWRVLNQVACGYYYSWDFGDADPELVIAWRAARKAWHRELRELLKRPQPGRDSPALVERAIARGEVVSESWSVWRAVALKVNPMTVTTWIDDYLIRDAKRFAAGPPAIVWYQGSAIGSELSDAMPVYDDQGALIDAIETLGHQSIALSIDACGTGVDGLQRAFTRQLVATPLQSGAKWEQLIGRTHRHGQRSSVTVYVYDRDTNQIEQAKGEARYIQETMGISQKLLTWQ